MSEVFFNELDISEPHINLNIGSGTHGQQTGEIMKRIEKILIKQNPDLVLVYGDTNSTLAGALAAAKLRIPLGHIEAGLRSFNYIMPEETNRLLTDHCSDFLFAPTNTAVQNLLNENINKEKIFHPGDVMYDAAMYYKNKSKKHTGLLEKYALKKNNYIIATIHRAENTDNFSKLEIILRAFDKISEMCNVLLPLHPRTKKFIEKHNIKLNPYKLKIIEPLSYLEMIFLESRSGMIITDSGGVQKEAYFFKKPCLTLRNETEWIELVNAGCNVICPPDSVINIFQAVKLIFKSEFNFNKLFYGNGKSAEKITNIIKKIFIR